MRTSVVVLAALSLGACTNGDKTISSQISELFDDAKVDTVDISKVGPKEWERMCVLGPYTDDAQAKEILGFPWDLRYRSSIATDDGINLLVFVRGQEGLAYTEHPRSKGDFLYLNQRCVPRSGAVFVRQPTSGLGVQLISQK
jgi:hypothetical protein